MAQLFLYRPARLLRQLWEWSGGQHIINLGHSELQISFNTRRYRAKKELGRMSIIRSVSRRGKPEPSLSYVKENILHLDREIEHREAGLQCSLPWSKFKIYNNIIYYLVLGIPGQGTLTCSRRLFMRISIF